MECIFCKILNKEIPSEILFEDEKIIVIADISPKAKFHALVIPKKHIESVDDDLSDDLLIDAYRAARAIARKYKIEKTGYKIITNIGPDAGQTVPHIHFHILGGEPLRGGLA